ncbi:outer membrane lipoprotein-sorting protein [Ferrimonas sediminicola]|uniref:Outer membrane lipoprotein-sorting protein n=1 Tax=Ferrimonas sediminicola TaxID=2569538 RepID=A0A4V5NVI6_9GAMM|nr:outer membrane lipoprotein-sorting protein [Ferrimonas sediminicola]TKB50633.1 outer membrane lipoprotein-sorting protein [Ferrimonas sediminicola]
MLRFLLLAASCLALPAQALDAREIVRLSDQQMRGESSYAEMTMSIIRPGWTRTMTMKSWTKGQDLSLVLVTAPARDRGSASLRRGREMWNWVPGIERIIKIAPSMLGQSWMGSDFTNDDLINQSSIVVDYRHRLLGTEAIDGEECWVIDAAARESAPVVWSRIKLWIGRESLLQRRAEFYDEFDERVNDLVTYDVKRIGGRLIATRMEMLPADKPGHLTRVITHQAQFDFDVDDSFFSQSQMKRLRD